MVLALLGAFKRRKQTLPLNAHFQAANFWVTEAPCPVREADFVDEGGGPHRKPVFTEDTE